ncbi:hypothetical protein [Nitrospirillum iridis]|uniref:Uncharacterized protein n=1 Tax=Nitrospirillum iridis TaxID=765888 RepID=A0A7X0EC77_9PROT|nr:hypothetical protein [Nitrospirillum iridis]MBB6251427.1 hypothetical protein [Nitrospirillum iridis]
MTAPDQSPALPAGRDAATYYLDGDGYSATPPVAPDPGPAIPTAPNAVRDTTPPPDAPAAPPADDTAGGSTKE